MALRLLDPVKTLRPPHANITVRRRLLLWHLNINGSTLYRSRKRSDAVILGGFVARISSPSTLEVVPTRKHPGEYREF